MMKNFSRRATALLLALLLLTTPTAWASVALGDDLQGVTVPLADGVSLTYDRFWSNAYQDLRTEQYFTYTPQSGTSPLVYFGNTITSTNTLSKMAQAIESEGKRVVGGVNGDFYVLSTGVPLGLVITDGVLRSSAAEHYGLGFTADGTPFIGQPQLSTTATFRDHSLIVSTLNKSYTTTGGYQLFTTDFGTTVPGGAVAVVLTPMTDNLGQTIATDLSVAEIVDSDGELVEDSTTEIFDTVVLSDQLGIGRRVVYRVEQVLTNASSVTIPTGSVVMTIGTESNEWLISELAAVEVGSSLDIDITSADDRWNSAYTALGALYLLVDGGVAQSGFAVEMAPRTAVGIKEDGSLLLYTIDGRTSHHSVGATLNQVAQRLVELGCVSAIALDGGGSTMAGTTLPDGDNMTVINVPSDGSERRVTNGLFLVADTVATGIASHYYVSPYDAVLLGGASVQLTASGVDSGWYPMDNIATPQWSIASGRGTVDENGLFTAPTTSGITTVTAQNGILKGSAAVTTVATPDQITLFNEETGGGVSTLALTPGDEISLTASAFYRHLPLTASDTDFIWQVSDGIGTIDSEGLFSTAQSSATGQLTVSAGGFSRTIDVTISGHLLPLEDFEGDNLTAFAGTSSTAVELNHTQVKYGHHSLQLDYDTTATGIATAPSFLTMPLGERFLNGWIYGDGSDNALMATIADHTGATRDIVLATLNFTGWQYFSAPLPEKSSNLTALSVANNGTATISTLWLDQLTTSTEQLLDKDAPTISLTTVDEGNLLACVNDNYVSSFEQAQISVLWDGQPLAFTWDQKSAIATIALPSYDDGLHRLTVTATDPSGNIGRLSTDFSAGATVVSPFPDSTNHWALPYISYLYDTGVTNGVATDTGLAFQPDKYITRGEFSLMVARWLGVNVDDYSNVTLPFDDTATIPTWALNGVKAMYSLGLMMGSQDGSSLNASANSSISRVQAMTILGRIQPKGYATPEMTFDDAGAVPSWALEYVQSLVGQGVIGGYNNQLKPNDFIKRGEVAKILFCMQ